MTRKDEAIKQYRAEVGKSMESLDKGIITLKEWVENDKASLEDTQARYDQLQEILANLDGTNVRFADLKNASVTTAFLIAEARSNIRTQQYNSLLLEQLSILLKRAMYLVYEIPYAMMEGMTPQIEQRMSELIARKTEEDKGIKVKVKKNIEKALQEWTKEREEERKKKEEVESRWRKYIG